ncbi:winged helix-turn-helix transcriptional regulator [Cellulomonas phragmiteti]|uniref:Transcriptional regulator n=1 Tax=Cellulomonas phragmiteti TaxID=478780 RepID=A0ABQ4DHE5_9CELL|nr:helix-turn-helix domain-containing protein [Cellulomonas phragmiteti]GIG38758.1 transcriptional regulator [Cellulomonas phragmiteti]
MTDTTPRLAERLAVGAPHRELLDQVLDKWSLAVLEELCEGPCRFNDLRRAVPGVTAKSLTSTLRRLERNGVVERRVLRDRPVTVEYRMTPLGKTLREPVDALLRWTTAHTAEVEAARDRFDAALDASSGLAERVREAPA